MYRIFYEVHICGITCGICGSLFKNCKYQFDSALKSFQFLHMTVNNTIANLSNSTVTLFLKSRCNLTCLILWAMCKV